MSKFYKEIEYIRIYCNFNDWFSEGVVYTRNKDSRLKSSGSDKDKLCVTMEAFFNNLNNLCDKHGEEGFPFKGFPLTARCDSSGLVGLFEQAFPTNKHLEDKLVKLFRKNGFDIQQPTPYYAVVKRLSASEKLLENI